MGDKRKPPGQKANALPVAELCAMMPRINWSFPDAPGIADGQKAASSQDKKACDRRPHRAISQLSVASNWGSGCCLSRG
jgi:hypothetical protein